MEKLMQVPTCQLAVRRGASVNPIIFDEYSMEGMNQGKFERILQNRKNSPVGIPIESTEDWMLMNNFKNWKISKDEKVVYILFKELIRSTPFIYYGFLCLEQDLILVEVAE